MSTSYTNKAKQALEKIQMGKIQAELAKTEELLANATSPAKQLEFTHRYYKLKADEAAIKRKQRARARARKARKSGW